MAGINIRSEILGLSELDEELDRIKAALEGPEMASALGDGAEQFVAAIQSVVPRKTYALYESIDMIQEGESWSIGPKGDVIYANIQNEGGTNTVYQPYSDGYQVLFTSYSFYVPATNYMEGGFVLGEEPAKAATIRAFKYFAGL